MNDKGEEYPILFLSDGLKPFERDYWATKLEMGALVWAPKKRPEYFDEGEFQVITDHSALVVCLRGKERGRRAARLHD